MLGIVTGNVFPLKGLDRFNNSYNKHPSIQISFFVLYNSPKHISGERKYGVPNEVLANPTELSKTFETPKSPSLIYFSNKVTLLSFVKKTFCDFISLWIIFRSCK
jgi:hypothetical protein